MDYGEVVILTDEEKVAAKAAAQDTLLNKRQALQANVVRYYQSLADKGDPEGQLRMGEFYRDGNGVPQDEAKAMEFFTKSSTQGNKDASRALEKRTPPSHKKWPRPTILPACQDLTQHAILNRMHVTVELPDQVARQWGETPDAVGRRVMEGAAIEGYRSGRLSHRQVGEMLGLDYWQTETFLQERGVALNYTLADAEADSATLAKILNRS